MKRLIMLAALILALLCLVSCTGQNAPDDGTTPTDSSTQPVPSAPPLEIVDRCSTEYHIVRPESASDTVVSAAKQLHSAMLYQYELESMNIESDFIRPNTAAEDIYKYELLIGNTDRAETQAALAEIRYNDFIICVSGTRVVIAGHNDSKTVEAVNYFIESYVSGSALTLPAELRYASSGSYAGEGVTLMGKPLSDYTLVYKGSYRSMAQTIADEVGMYTGVVLDMSVESATVEGPKIIIGSTKYGVRNDYAVDSFSVSVKDDSILIGGRGEWPMGSACRYLIRQICSTTGDVAQSALDYNYVRPDRQEYINDISKLAMHWDIYFDTPEWMLDYEEKYAAMNDADGRLMSCLHRGDMVYYPENSIEGIISAIRMGADMVEIDPRRTSDGVLVLMHDTTLTRTTNFNEMAGKNGLPWSENICDWTYEQLCQLSLRTANGGSGSTVTEYKIPTLDEVMKVCAERIFVRLDKLDQWSYVKDIWPMIEKYKAYTTVIFTWHDQFYSSGYATVKTYKKKMEAAVGRSAFSFVGCTITGSSTNTLATIRNNNLDYCVRLHCDFSNTTPEAYIASGKALLAGLRGKTRCYIDIPGNGAKYETEKYYAMLDEAGINVLLCNKGLRMCQYIAENYSATP